MDRHEFLLGQGRMILDPILDLFRGKAVTTPPMDGALKPNTLLDEAEVIATPESPDCLLYDGVSLLYASGTGVFRPGRKDPIAEFPSPVTAIALSPSGQLAVGLNSGEVRIGSTAIEDFNCPTALAFDGEDLLVCNGSRDVAPRDWVKDLMHRNASGSVWRVGGGGKTRTQLAGNLAFPFGITADKDSQRIVFSESWAHRLSAVPAKGGAVSTVLPHLPGYPCRITPVFDGYLLALFAPMNRLVQFVLQEDDYRAAMMREIDPQFWIAPTLSPSHSFLEPLQNGSVKSMGVHKPWSPTRSCGLLVRLDAKFRPVASYHSRANGRHHGVTSAIEVAGRYIIAAKGGNVLLSVDPGMEVR
jgi:hypothetical protein